jgi:uncharacterized peroxidase-related enzyme
MSGYQFHTPESAPEAARPVLADAKKSMGFVPNLFAGLANAPAALNAYVDISANFDTTSLTPAERQVVLLTTSVVNGCEFCVAAHSMIAKRMAEVPAAEVAAIREDRAPSDTKLMAIWALTKAIVEERGWVADHPAFAEFLAAGYTREQVLEVILGVTQKTLSNYTNHLLGTPLNSALEGERWERK